MLGGCCEFCGEWVSHALFARHSADCKAIELRLASARQHLSAFFAHINDFLNGRRFEA